MQDTKGKVILSLLAGATAGVVAGLLLAPETGTDTRANLKKSASKLSDELGKLLQDGLVRFGSAKEPATPNAAQHRADRSAADNLLSSFGGQDASHFDDADSDYDGIGGDARHSSGYGRGL